MVYENPGNAPLLAMIPDGTWRVLDVGCGAGQNARLLQQRGCRVTGITLSPEEAERAGGSCERVLVCDLEIDSPDLEEHTFDVLLLSHVLEHLRSPARVLSNLAALLKPGGLAAIAVPNMAFWRLRWRLIRGDWTRQDTGFFDRTHLQFWSYQTAPLMLENTPFVLEQVRPGSPAAPLWWLRRAVPGLAARIDVLSGALVPNAFAVQTLLVARLEPMAGRYRRDQLNRAPP